MIEIKSQQNLTTDAIFTHSLLFLAFSWLGAYDMVFGDKTRRKIQSKERKINLRVEFLSRGMEKYINMCQMFFFRKFYPLCKRYEHVSGFWYPTVHFDYQMRSLLNGKQNMVNRLQKQKMTIIFCLIRNACVYKFKLLMIFFFQNRKMCKNI